MSIKQNGGVFGRNPTFNDLTIEGDLILNGEIFTGLDFQGSWNASTNSPSLASSTGTNGEFYIVSVAGTTNLNGITNWGIGDWAIFNGTVWQRVEGGADGNFDALTANSLVVTGTSYIQSTTAPQLELAYNSGNITGFYRSGGDFQIKNDNGAGSPETSIVLAEDGAVTLYHDANPKIATTSSGVNVTGTVTADDEVKVTAASGFGRMEVGGPDGAFVDLKSPDSDDYDLRIKTTGTGGEIDTAAGEFVIKRGSATKLSTSSGGVDITGDIAVSGNITTDGLVHKDDSNTYVKFLPDRIYMDVGGQRRIDAEVNSTKIVNEDTIKLQTGSSITDGLVINASQNVSIPNGDLGIGFTGTPSRALDVSTAGSTILANFKNTGGTTSHITLGNTTSTADQIRIGSDGTALTLATAYTEGLRIDGSQNVSIPNGTLSVGGVGSIGTSSGDLAIFSTDSGHTGFRFGNGAIVPTNNSGGTTDNACGLGTATGRFSQLFAANGTIQTSDRNEKQDIESLTEAEERVAVAAKSLLKKFRWKDAVEAKGDDARIHFGIIAQDLQAAFEAEGLDAGRYGMFTSNTWWEHNVEVPAVEAVEGVQGVATVEAQEAVMGERQKMETVETGTYVNLAGETITETQEVGVTEDVVQTVVERQDIDGVMTEVEVEKTVSVPVMESYEVSPAVEAVAGVEYVEAVEAADAYTRTDTYDTAEEAPEGSVEKTRMGVRYSELLAFIISAI